MVSESQGVINCRNNQCTKPQTSENGSNYVHGSNLDGYENGEQEYILGDHKI